MTEKNTKRLSLRQELRKAANLKLAAMKQIAYDSIAIIAKNNGVKVVDLIKSISKGFSKTADHNLVTQLANKAETDLIKLWNDQQNLDLEKKDD